MVASKILPAALLLALASTSYTQQTSCSMDVAIPIESLMGTGSSSSSSGSNTGSGEVDLDDIIENAINGIANEIIEDALDKRFTKRALSCVGTESCFSIGTVAFCIDPASGDYHNEIEKGNIITGDYVRNDGRKGNLYSTSIDFTASTYFSTPTATATSPRITPTTSVETRTTAKGAVGTGSADADSVDSTPVSTWWTNAPTQRASTTTSVGAVTGPPPAATALNPTGGGVVNKASFGAVVAFAAFAAFLC